MIGGPQGTMRRGVLGGPKPVGRVGEERRVAGSLAKIANFLKMKSPGTQLLQDKFDLKTSQI